MVIDNEDVRLQAKRAMRQRARAVRSSMPELALRARNASICERLSKMGLLQGASKIALYWPMKDRNEVDLRSLDGQWRAAGKRLYYPAIDATSKRMSFRLATDPKALVDRGAGFLEPAADAPEAKDLDAILVPGLLFDARGYRIGYGGGYYDRTLPDHRPQSVAIGVAFAFQLAVELPNTRQDVPVQLVVTDESTIQVADPS